jgi:hypothetical protein
MSIKDEDLKFCKTKAARPQLKARRIHCISLDPLTFCWTVLLSLFYTPLISLYNEITSKRKKS